MLGFQIERIWGTDEWIAVRRSIRSTLRIVLKRWKEGEA